MKRTNNPGTPAQYAEAMKMMIQAGEDIEALNRLNHKALADKRITLAHFQAAAMELAKVILSR